MLFALCSLYKNVILHLTAKVFRSKERTNAIIGWLQTYQMVFMICFHLCWYVCMNNKSVFHALMSIKCVISSFPPHFCVHLLQREHTNTHIAKQQQPCQPQQVVTTVDTMTVPLTEVFFPSVVVCNINQVRKSFFEELGIYDNETFIRQIYFDYIEGKKDSKKSKHGVSHFVANYNL